MRTNYKFITFLLIALMLISFASCGADSTGRHDTQLDREGNPIKLPETMERIISMGPSNAEILVALGFGDKIIAVDTYSENIDGIGSGLPMFSMMAPDGEQIIALHPDIIFVSGMAKADGIDPFKVIADAGICIVFIPSSTNIAGIKEDIRYISDVLGVESMGKEIISEMETEIAKIKSIGDTITDKKSVYFEVEAAPRMYSFGSGTFLNEMIELIGAENILSGQNSWLSVADEAILNAGPDVILTSVNYTQDPVGEIKSRAGWEAIPAVANGDVYYIDADSSNRPNQNIVKALKEMAKAVYPDKY